MHLEESFRLSIEVLTKNSPIIVLHTFLYSGTSYGIEHIGFCHMFVIAMVCSNIAMYDIVLQCYEVLHHNYSKKSLYVMLWS